MKSVEKKTYKEFVSAVKDRLEQVITNVVFIIVSLDEQCYVGPDIRDNYFLCVIYKINYDFESPHFIYCDKNCL